MRRRCCSFTLFLPAEESFKMKSVVLLLLCLSCCPGSVGSASAVEDAYSAVVGVVSPGQRFLSGESLRSLFNTLQKRVQCGEVPCGKCDLAGSVHQLIGNHSVHGTEENGNVEENVTVSVSQFPALAAGSVLYLSSPGSVCTAVGQGTWGEETDRFLHKHTHSDHRSHTHIGVVGLESVIQDLQNHYEPSNNKSCVAASSIMAAVDPSFPDQKQEVGAVMGRVLYYALLGNCFSGQSLPEENFFLDYIMTRLGSENFTVHDLEVLMKNLNIGSEDDHDHSEDTDHHRRKHSRSSSNWEHHCFTADELIQIYKLTEESSGMGRSGVAKLSPALVQQILSGSCTNVSEPVTPEESSPAEKYLYATIANVIITLISMLGIVMLLCTSCTKLFQMCVQFCISMAVGALTGDALLHLVPMVLGIHVHTEDGSDSHQHSNGDHAEIPDYTYKMLTVVGGVYVFYLMETIFSLVTNENEHNHDKGNESNPHHCDHVGVLEMYQQEKKQKQKSQSVSKADLVDDEDKEERYDSEQKKRRREKQLLPYMITIGDGIHNFADGLAIGAAFSMSWKSGLATSVAVFCHELPHELGDFAILLHCGLSVQKALLLNVGSALTSFIGLYISLSVATDLATQQWIGAIAAGLFLYIGLADMLPTLVHVSSKKPWHKFLLQNAGILTGWILLLLLSLYEDKISF
ncbi:zinc transporter ZIP4 [Poeciliopsis prolifica]|uniref:zinc transporter ZIP4 n=1 Tax=Poeciliopsis prolifica TaxID=188132 RepID=UPI0024139094|nr:zinc transporter ZIP4 [Poeciliopsis prolifica]